MLKLDRDILTGSWAYKEDHAAGQGRYGLTRLVHDIYENTKGDGPLGVEGL